MKQTRKKSSRLKIILILVIGVLLIGSAYFAIKHFSTTQANTSPSSEPAASIDYTEPTKQDLQNGAAIKDQAATKDNTSVGTPGEKASDVQITSTSSTNDTFSLRALINKPISDGTCKLSMVRAADGKSYTATAQVQAMASTGTCKGFDVPGASLGQGTWNIVVSVEQQGVSTITAEKQVSIP